MKKLSIVCLAVVMAVVFGYGSAFANPEGVCPDGKLIGHLKIIGVKSDKNVNMEGNGSVIFVDLGAEDEPATTEISLIQGDDFAVLDKNGTDGDAVFMLPPTGLEPYIIGENGGANTWSDYSVFLRALGTPGGKATITTCAEVAAAFAPWISNKTAKALTDPAVGDTVCSLEQVTSDILVRNSSKPKFINVTAELLTIVFEVTLEDGSVITVRVPIFSGLLEDEYWKYDNEGLKNLDVRFYDCSTDVSEGDDAF
ncbi:MAG: hypothetical protein KAT52_09010 [Desulfobacterales bacterium]|nr:hypothetical protein [Desulfobacterales bacterium]